MSDQSFDIINPPHGVILAIGAGQERAVVKNGKIEVATVMTVSASFGHRVIDASVGAEYMSAFKKLIENPVGLIL